MFTKYIPNILCLFRIFCVFPFIYCLIFNDKLGSIFSVALGGLSDFFDGYIARKYRCETRLGALLDPLADKIFANVVLWSLVMFHEVSFPYLCVYLILALALSFRDFILLLGSCFVLFRHVKIDLKPLYISKICTTLVFIFIAYSIMFAEVQVFNLPEPFGLYIGYAGVLLVIVTFIAYIARFIKNILKNGN